MYSFLKPLPFEAFVALSLKLLYFETITDDPLERLELWSLVLRFNRSNQRQQVDRWW